MKKAFSLLLIGVVAVSMFSFIRPNCVDAAGELQYMQVIIDRSTLLDRSTHLENGYFKFAFFDENIKEISGGIRSIEFYTKDPGRRDQRIELPAKAKRLMVEVLTPTIAGQKKRTQSTITALIHNVYRRRGQDGPIIKITICPEKVDMENNPNDCIAWKYDVKR